jgi:hypothetical protein
MLFYEYNLRRRCVTREQLDQEKRMLRLLLAGPCSDDQRRALVGRLACVKRLLEELQQTTLAL